MSEQTSETSSQSLPEQRPFKVVIPARYASTRLPGKPLLDIAGKPMIERVYDQALKSNAEAVIIATDDERIATLMTEKGAQVVMTSPDHPSGTDRLQEVCQSLGLADDELIVNVQGDEPLIPPAVINQVAKNLARYKNAGIATLCERITDLDDVFNPNAVKVVFDGEGIANYFSRAPIPWYRDGYQSLSDRPQTMPQGVDYFRHIGIYAYRVGFLHSYVTWAPSMTEQAESLEQLRALSNGVQVHVEEAEETLPAGVDTEADLERVRAIFAG